MRLFQLSAALILCTSMFCAAEDDSTTQDKPKLPDAAQRIMDGYHKDADALERDYLRKLQTEERKVLADLDKASKDVARKGDVDGAVAIKEQIKLLEDKLDHEKPASNMFANPNDNTLTIISAKYGADTRWADVTKYVQKNLEDNKGKLDFVDDNHVFCEEVVKGDPAPYCSKQIVIVYKIGSGDSKTTTFNEHQHILLPLPASK